MPVRVSHLIQNRRTLTIPVGDDAVTVTYRPGALTPATLDRILTAQNENDQARLLAAMVGALPSLIAGWDLLDDDEQPYPTTREALSELPFSWLLAVWQAVSEDSRPNSMSGETSAAG